MALRIQGARAFVLHVRRWRETSLLVDVLSLEHGRLGLAARGVQTPKRHALRAALQPLQHVIFDAVLRGELATLQQAEALDTPPSLTGSALLSSFYVNELLLRLLPRQDPHPEIYAAYAQVRGRLGSKESLSWILRRFERDVLAALGLGFEYLNEGDGTVVEPDGLYRLDPEYGPRRVMGAVRSDVISGRSLQALAADQVPPEADLPGIRLAMRRVIAYHLGPRGLKSWELMAALRPLATRQKYNDNEK